jgi:hypothetical protein
MYRNRLVNFMRQCTRLSDYANCDRCRYSSAPQTHWAYCNDMALNEWRQGFGNQRQVPFARILPHLPHPDVLDIGCRQAAVTRGSGVRKTHATPTFVTV